MLAIELVEDPGDQEPAPHLASAVTEAAATRLLLLKSGIYSNCIRVLTPLTLSDAELDEARGLGASLEAVSANPAVAFARMSAGDLIAGRYELVELIGRGGMSSVWRRTTGCSTARLRSGPARAVHEGRGVRRALPARGAPSPSSAIRTSSRSSTAARKSQQYIVFECVEGELKQVIEARARCRSATRFARPADGPRALVRSRPWIDPPGRQAAERPAERGRPGEDDRLRDRPAVDVEGVTITGTVLGTSEYIARASRGQRVAATDVYRSVSFSTSS